MLCDICHNKTARIFYTEIINGEKKEQHLCEECAAECTVNVNGMPGKELPIGNILTGILQNYAKGMASRQNGEAVCSRCNMTAAEFLKRGSFGCSECYTAFESILEKNIKTMQAGAEHHGKMPQFALREMSEKQAADDGVPSAEEQLRAELEELRAQLKKAVAVEDYEEAARLRDIIREKEKNGQ